MGTTATVAPSGDPYVDGLLAGRRWSSALTYSFPTSTGQYEPGYTDQGALTNGWSTLNASQVTAANYMAGLVNSYILQQLTFTGNDGTGDIRFANSNNASGAYAYYPDGTDSTGGDIFIGDAENNRTPVMGSYGWQTYSHELGHALGLKHPFDAGDEPAFTGKIMPLDRDGIEFTVMTYKSGVGRGNGYTNEDFGYPTTFMQYDILALQYLYGANYGSNAGNTTYRWDPNTGQMFIGGVAQPLPAANRIFLTVWDGGGRDLYDFSNYATNLTVDLRAGGWSVLSTAQLADLGQTDIARGNVFNAFQVDGDTRSLIEDVRGGSGNDTLTGNQASNQIFGNTGNDTIYGGDGTDFIDGSFGVDVIYGDAGNESIFGGADADTVYGGDGDDNSGGDAGDNVVYGDDGNNILQGWTGNDTLVGGNFVDSLFGGDGNDNQSGGSGVDALDGGVGNDTMFGGAGSDFLNGMQDNDIIFAGDGNESIFGGTGNDTVFGEDGNDVIDGHSDNDTLYGGAGDDTLFGGQGVDTFFGGAGNDALWGFHLADLFVYSSIPGGNGNDFLGDFGDGGDKVQLIGLSISTFNGTMVLLSDGTTLNSGGHVWVAGDFVT
jgi:serralysin